jgi:hypothetical protein
MENGPAKTERTRQRFQRADPLSVDVRQIQRSKLYFGYDGAFNVLSETPG